MRADGAALLLLAWTLLVAFAAIVMLVRGASARAALAERGRMEGPGPIGARFAELMDAGLRRTRPGRRLWRWLQSTGATVRAGDFVALCASAAFLATVLFSLFVPVIIAFLVALAVVAGAARAWGERRRTQRREAFIGQLPDLARVLSNGTSAGLSMAGAIELAAREMPEPAAGEMRTVVEQMRVGASLDSTLEALRDRLPSREVSVLMSTLIIQQRAGGDTVRALSELGATLEARKDLKREIRTLLAGSVFNSYLVAGIGGGVLLLVNGIQPGLLRKMTSTAIGILALSVAALLWGFAYVLIRRTTSVEA